jgi:hypothetical protein
VFRHESGPCLDSACSWHSGGLSKGQPTGLGRDSVAMAGGATAQQSSHQRFQIQKAHINKWPSGGTRLTELVELFFARKVLHWDRTHWSQSPLALLNYTCIAVALSSYGPTALVGLGRFFSFLIHTQSVGLLGRGISPSQGRYLHTKQHEHRHPCLEWESNPRS